MNLNHATNKAEGSTLSAQEWNSLAADVNELGAGGAGGGADMSSYLYMNDKGNLCLETTAENTPSGKKGKLNIESNDDILLKPGDDIMLYGDHRGEGKTDEVSIKVMDGTGNSDVPAKLQLNMSEITLTTKDKAGNDSNVLDINVNRAKNTKGYLKVRAQAIDLRCEEHGGIALQPKGEDGQGHMNKIKFEHGGGDGLEFGTFNTEHTSLFTTDYRFNKNGIIRLATRQTEVSDKADANDPTTAYKYVKQADDFYDITSGPTCTWSDIVSYISWMKSNSIGIFHAKDWMDSQLSGSNAGIAKIRILRGINKSASALTVVDRASNIKTTINGTEYDLTPVIVNNGLKLVGQYQGHDNTVFFAQSNISHTNSIENQPGLAYTDILLTYDPVSSADTSNSKVTIGDFDFVGLF